MLVKSLNFCRIFDNEELRRDIHTFWLKTWTNIKTTQLKSKYL